MNWSRGFFRAWLVVSLLWIAGIGTLTFNTWPRDDWQPSHPADRYQSKPATPADPYANFAPASDAQMDAMALHRREVMGHLWRAAWLSLLPPAVALGFGCALLWVSRGFRKV